MAEDAILRLTLAVIIGTLLAIVYCMRILVLMERRVARMELHIEKIAERVLREEIRIEQSLKKRKRR
ncbi:MAG: hypothetical protein AABX52_02370 [Nanoarchaeota archaeon]